MSDADRTRAPPRDTSIEDPAARETNAWSKRRGGPSPSLVGQTVGSYRVTRVLGEGGVGTVYLGEHPRVGSRVAIKVLHDDFVDSEDMVDRFVREARAANAVKSPHIVPITDFGKLADGRDYAVMEYLVGEALDGALDAEEPWPVARAAAMLVQVAEAMEAAHRAGIIHRDLKPENIFLEARDDCTAFVRILDFGIAKLADVDEPNARKTAVGTVLGTPIYCAPEQGRGEEVTAAADIYALGAVAYEVLTGRPVFQGNVVDVLVGKATRDPPPLGRADVPAEVEELVMQMLARDPAARPGSMRDVRARLAPFAAPTLTRDVSAEESGTLVSASSSPERTRLSSGTPLVVTPAADGYTAPVGAKARRVRVVALGVIAAFGVAGAIIAAVLAGSHGPSAASSSVSLPPPPQAAVDTSSSLLSASPPVPTLADQAPIASATAPASTASAPRPPPVTPPRTPPTKRAKPAASHGATIVDPFQ